MQQSPPCKQNVTHYTRLLSTNEEPSTESAADSWDYIHDEQTNCHCITSHDVSGNSRRRRLKLATDQLPRSVDRRPLCTARTVNVSLYSRSGSSYTSRHRPDDTCPTCIIRLPILTTQIAESTHFPPR